MIELFITLLILIICKLLNTKNYKTLIQTLTFISKQMYFLLKYLIYISINELITIIKIKIIFQKILVLFID